LSHNSHSNTTEYSHTDWSPLPRATRGSLFDLCATKILSSMFHSTLFGHTGPTIRDAPREVRTMRELDHAHFLDTRRSRKLKARAVLPFTAAKTANALLLPLVDNFPASDAVLDNCTFLQFTGAQGQLPRESPTLRSNAYSAC
jgi:hypothetical protein